MRILTVLAIFLTAVSCNQNQDASQLGTARIENINQIVSTIIIHDSLKILKNDENPIELLENLRKLRVYVPSKEAIEMGAPDPPPPNITSITTLLSHSIHGKRFFRPQDSLGLVKQYPETDSLKIDTAVLKNVSNIGT